MMNAGEIENEIAPELTSDRIEYISSMVAAAMGDDNVVEQDNKAQRYAAVRSLARDAIVDKQGGLSPKQLVYGELSIPVLATLLDAVGVQEGDVFLDIGSGDGSLVLGAALLYPSYIDKCRGIEVVPGLVERSKCHASNILELSTNDNDRFELSNVEFFVGDVHSASTDASIAQILQDSTLVICFATTWSADNIVQQQQEGRRKRRSTSLQRRLLPRLSKALTDLPLGARIILVDARLDCNDGYTWEGDLRIQCPDTAPYSIASLYRRTWVS